MQFMITKDDSTSEKWFRAGKYWDVRFKLRARNK